MPITSSAKKALRQNVRRRKRNVARKAAAGKAVKLVRKLALAKNTDEARAKLAEAYQAIDKAARTNIYTKNKASRLKSRLAKLLK